MRAAAVARRARSAAGCARCAAGCASTTSRAGRRVPLGAGGGSRAPGDRPADPEGDDTAAAGVSRRARAGGVATAALDDLAAARGCWSRLDFDGVLAPIVEDPGDAAPLPASRAASAAARRGRRQRGAGLRAGPGRPAHRRRPAGAALLVGSHGAQVADGGERPWTPTRAPCWTRSSRRCGSGRARHPGTSVELKPAGAVLHTRRADRDVAAAATRQAVEGSPPGTACT